MIDHHSSAHVFFHACWGCELVGGTPTAMIYMIAVASRRCRSTPTTSPVTEEYDKDSGAKGMLHPQKKIRKHHVKF